ncbi:MAG: ATP-binding protein [Chloroflexota bacterium]
MNNNIFWQRIQQLFIPPPLKPLRPDSNINVALQQGRERILTALLRFASVLAVIILLVVMNNLLTKQRWDLIAFYLILSLIVWTISFFRTIDFRLRTYSFLTIVYLLGVIDLGIFGMAEDWRLYFFAFTLLISVFLGWKAGAVALILSTLTFAVIATQISLGNIVITASGMDSPIPNSENIITFAAMFFFLTGVVVSAIAALLREFEAAWVRERHAAKLVQQERDFLEERVAERTHALENRNQELERSRRNAIEARRAAEMANEAKNSFLAGMSHELRTPLNGILGYTQILQQMRHLGLREQDALRVIDESGKHLLSLINDILDLSKIEAQKLELRQDVVPFADFLDNLANIMRPRVQEKQLTFHYLLGEGLPTAVLADETRLRQVLINLLNNAIKFTETGSVTLDVSCQAKETNAQGHTVSHLRFKVIDTGIGIAQSEQERIFQPFEQASNRWEKAEGIGLGLAISQSLVQSMGGYIRLESTQGEGSCFWFDLVLPTAVLSTSKRPVRQRQIIGYEGPSQRVLIVDDIAQNRDVLVKMLAPLNFELFTAESGEEAVALVDVVQPTIVLMDLVMRGLSGMMATEQIRQKPQGDEIAIVIVSADIRAETRAESLAAGCNAFLEKPVNREALLAVLAEQLELVWVYEAGDETAVSTPIHFPPIPVLTQLSQLARLGDMAALTAQLDELSQSDSNYLGFAQHIQTLAHSFADDEILDFLATADLHSKL